MKLKALIFDVDGTIANTERDGHLPACNDAFAQFNYPVHWSWVEYKQLLQLPGTQVRVRQALAQIRPDWTGSMLDEAAEVVTAVKRQIYLEKYVTAVSLCPGIKELVSEAVTRHVKLAVITLSHEAQVVALLQKQIPEFANAFHPILGKEAGPKYGPGAPLYVRCLAELGLTRDEVLVVEDSEGGTAAAVDAGLPVVVTYNEYTRNGRFPGARLITPTLTSFTLEQLSFLCLEN
ncbi:MAG: HAD hydrolase-like protein [Ardenticatenaceae bacterium]|nr:HAD hydrolase-like protein [Ardenticatenaceae bacterium]